MGAAKIAGVVVTHKTQLKFLAPENFETPGSELGNCKFYGVVSCKSLDSGSDVKLIFVVSI